MHLLFVKVSKKCLIYDRKFPQNVPNVERSENFQVFFHNTAFENTEATRNSESVSKLVGQKVR